MKLSTEPSNEMSRAEVRQLMSTDEVRQLMKVNLETQALIEMSTPEHHQLTLSILSIAHQLTLSILELPRVEDE